MQELTSSGFNDVTGTVTQDSGEYKYVYAGLTWEQYWASEGVYEATNTSASEDKDRRGESDKGGFDAVTRATANHGLHRGSFQTMATVYDANGKTYALAGWKDKTTMILTDGSTVSCSKGKINGIDVTEYKVTGLKYIPVKVKTADYDAFKKAFKVVENGENCLVVMLKITLVLMKKQQKSMQIPTDLRQQQRTEIPLHSAQEQTEQLPALRGKR